VFIFGSPLSSDAKCNVYFIVLLERKLGRHSTSHEAFVYLPPAIGVNLMTREYPQHYNFLYFSPPWDLCGFWV
jgi:hypothetical protein